MLKEVLRVGVLCCLAGDGALLGPEQRERVCTRARTLCQQGGGRGCGCSPPLVRRQLHTHLVKDGFVVVAACNGRKGEATRAGAKRYVRAYTN